MINKQGSTMIQCAFVLALGLAVSGCGKETVYVEGGPETTPPPPLFISEPGEDPRCVEDYNACVVQALQKPGKASQPHVEKCLRELERCRE